MILCQKIVHKIALTKSIIKSMILCQKIVHKIQFIHKFNKEFSI
jgi:hypothetical protein